MRHLSLSLFFVVSFALVGCRSRVSSSPSDYVGEYLFGPSNVSPPEGFASFVVLKPDHEAVEIRFDRGSGTVHTKTENWYLSRSTGQNVVIGNYSCSVEISRSAIRLVLNDVGQYYEKVR
jgi:hypothetical protein